MCRLDEDRPFALVDTGGISAGNAHLETGNLAGATARQARAGAEEADLVLFVVDGREGPSALDDEILSWLRKASRPTFLVVNKTDGIDARESLAEFSRYGFTDVFAVSSAHRHGIDDLVDDILARLPEQGEAPVPDNDPERIRVAFVGRPNVGKSTLVNRILGEERMIASEVAPTAFDRRDLSATAAALAGRHRRIRRKSAVD